MIDPMSVRNIVLAIFFTSLGLGLAAQDAGAPYRSLTPNDQWELGVHVGLPFIVGDLDAKPGFGGGLHVRKSLDHIFSLRGVLLYGQAKNEGTNNRTSENSWFGGSGQMVVALNNIRFNKPNRKVLLNAFAGLGYDKFTATYENIQQIGGGTANGEVSEGNAHMDLGLGVSFRINPKINFSVEHTVTSVFGGNADLLDGDNNAGDQVTTYRDFLHYPHLSLNFNIGKSKDGVAKSEPLYWVNPMEMTAKAISDLEARPIYDPTDTDKDGIIDAIDEEDESPAGARVDTKGVTLDSDADKVPDYKDKEPYSPPGYAVDAMGVAKVPKPITEDDVNRIVDAKLAKFKLPEIKQRDWFLPMVNFKDNSYTVEKSEYSSLYQIAQVIKANPDVKVVVTGYTDKRASEGYNNVLSYNRAKSAIEFLVSQYGVSRDRLVLNWAGENASIDPAKGSSMINRRAEFKVASSETEMARPEGPEAGKGKFQGNINSGF